MSYISSNIGPSPFLTSSHHHFHSSNYTSSHPHYSTNSYTSTPTYLAAYATPAPVYQEKYFPKDMINVLPGVTNLASQDQEKLIHPLNTYSGNVFSTHCMNSPFNRGEIYHGNKDTKISSGYSTSSATLADNKGAESFLNKKDNPFNKKYLLSEKNKQLENYALYSSIEGYELYEYNRNRKKISSQNVKKFLTKRQPTFSSEDIADAVLQMTSKQNINVSKRDRQKNQLQGSNQKRSDKYSPDENPFQNHILGEDYQDEYLVESQVDEKQFGSFGQGKQQNNSMEVQEYKKYKSYETSRDNLQGKAKDQTDSIIVGLTNIVGNQNYKSKTKQQKTKREPVFIESEDDERKSGTFTVPSAIIEEINNPRIPSNVLRKKEYQTNSSNEKQLEKQKSRYSKQEATQVGKNPPNRITMRGKTYEKISL